MDKRPIGYVPGKGNPLDKKPPKNPKFDNVKKTLDTGLTTQHIEVISDATIAKRKGEIFRRIKSSTLANMLQQERNFESIYNTDSNQNDNFEDNQSIYSLQSHQTGVSQLSAVTYATEQLGLTANSSFLLLDIRDPEDFDLCHIKEATNFPAPNITRDKFIAELYRFKNKEDKIIVLYHTDERNGMPYATSMTQKGYDNVYLLSGGIEVFLEDFSALCEGKKVPVVQKKPTEDKKIQKRSNYKEQRETGDFQIENKNYVDQNDTRSQADDRSTISKSPSVLTSISKQKTNTRTNTNMNMNTSQISSISKDRNSVGGSQKWMP